MEYLTLREVEFVAHELAIQMMNGDEPIPPFESRFLDRLESCLSTPEQTYDKKELYPTLLDKASILFYLMIKSHPFKNGNKRVAIMTLIYFLYKNKAAFISSSKENFGFIIESQEFVEIFKSQFEFLWKSCKPIKNEESSTKKALHF